LILQNLSLKFNIKISLRYVDGKLNHAKNLAFVSLSTYDTDASMAPFIIIQTVDPFCTFHVPSLAGNLGVGVDEVEGAGVVVLGAGVGLLVVVVVVVVVVAAVVAFVEPGVGGGNVVGVSDCPLTDATKIKCTIKL